jgi:GTPase SAR1 family protein
MFPVLWLLAAILYRLKMGQGVTTTTPTVGFNVESVQYKKVKFNVWDVGGQDKIRPLWRHYYTGSHGLIFVVDCPSAPFSVSLALPPSADAAKICSFCLLHCLRFALAIDLPRVSLALIRSFFRSSCAATGGRCPVLLHMGDPIQLDAGADRDRIDEAKDEFHKIVSDREMKEAIILVFANKQDLKGAVTPEELPGALELEKLNATGRNWYVQPCIATTGEGITEGLSWLSQHG